MDLSRDARRLLEQCSAHFNADILLLCGDVDEALTQAMIGQCEARGGRPNVLLIFITQGGDANAAYRFARYLQSKYRKFSICIPYACKSAGTLMAIGAHELIMGPFGEIGPLDVQFYKTDSMDETSSGLVANASLKALETTAIEMFERCFLRLHTTSSGLVTLKTAATIASEIVAKILSPVYSQIDPFRIGENDLAMRVAKDYGERLAKRSGNLQSKNTLKMLVESYPSHDFVIDRTEAATIFKNVREPEPVLLRAARALHLSEIAEAYSSDMQIAEVLASKRSAPAAPAPDKAEEAAPLPNGGAEAPAPFHQVRKGARRAQGGGAAQPRS